MTDREKQSYRLMVVTLLAAVVLGYWTHWTAGFALTAAVILYVWLNASEADDFRDPLTFEDVGFLNLEAEYWQVNGGKVSVGIRWEVQDPQKSPLLVGRCRFEKAFPGHLFSERVH